jgi:dTDP-4-amino-4,6-dideoxygalactose transaminase
MAISRQKINGLGFKAQDLLLDNIICEKIIENKIKKKLNIPNSDLLINSSARDSFHFILQNLKKNTKKRKVLISAFNFSLMKEIIEKSGYEPVFVDVNIDSFNMSLSDLKKKYDTECGIAIITHLLGNPVSNKIIEFLRNKKTIIIEDCAHTFNSIYESDKTSKNYFVRKTGSVGDVSIFSFNFSKSLSSIYGAAIILNNQYLENIKLSLLKIKKKNKRYSSFKEMKLFLKGIITRILFSKSIFSLLTFNLVKLTYDVKKNEDFIDKLSKDAKSYFPKKITLLNKLGLIILKNNLNKINKKNEISIRNNINFKKNIKNKIQESNSPKYLFSVIVDNKKKTKRNLMKNNIDIKSVYCYDISKGECQNSKFLEEHVIYLPFYSGLKKTDISKMSHLLS